MNILIVLAHPDPNSFNHAIASTCLQRLSKSGHTVILHDLHKENFDPLLPVNEIIRNGSVDATIQMHCNELVKSDAIIIIHPNWWGQPPAILKGWIDRVIRPGVAYGFKAGDNGEGIPVGFLKAKVGIVFNTSNTSEFRENSVFKDPLDTIWRNCIFDFCGVSQFERKIFRTVITSDLQQRQKWLREVEEVLDKHF